MENVLAVVDEADAHAELRYEVPTPLVQIGRVGGGGPGSREP